MLERVVDDFKTPSGMLEFGVELIVALCVAAVLIAVLLNFLEGSKRKNTKVHQRSFVATGSMTLFFILYYLVIRSGTGSIPTGSFGLRVVLAVPGLTLTVTGCIVNILGRLALGNNWANHIKIYGDHSLVKASVYRYLRHPLYAGLIYMFYGASMVYANWLAAAANTLVFIPMMVYRARQEERLLSRQFEEYSEYAAGTGMFFPKLLQKNTSTIHERGR